MQVIAPLLSGLSCKMFPAAFPMLVETMKPAVHMLENLPSPSKPYL